MEKREQPKSRRVLLYSGGMDSFLANFFWQPTIRLYVHIGHRYATQELAAMKKIGLPFVMNTRLNLCDLEREDAIIPLRNLYFIALASHYGDHIGVGVLNGEINGDKSHEFATLMEQVLDVCYGESYWCEGREIQVTYPIAQWSKAQAVKEYIHRGGSVVQLLQTTSCYNGGTEVHCGWCSNCIKRYIALKLNAINEPYDCSPHESPYLEQIVARWETFSTLRKRETLLVFPELVHRGLSEKLGFCK